ncbi:hypothetical protein D3C76_1206850 [compost metagenome]
MDLQGDRTNSEPVECAADELENPSQSRITDKLNLTGNTANGQRGHHVVSTSDERLCRFARHITKPQMPHGHIRVAQRAEAIATNEPQAVDVEITFSHDRFIVAVMDDDSPR